MTDEPAITLGALRRAGKAFLEREPGEPIRTFFVTFHPSIEAAVRGLPNFVPAEKYRSMQADPNEIGAVELFKFVRDDAVQSGTWSIA